MAETVIHARDLRKVYRLYNGPGARFLDMFGLLRNRPGAFTEHAALDGVSLDITRGEKVAFIGRNGAGKSTLLKLVTRVIEPTSGTLEVRGKIHALLQIGTGFHPDFTGRQNVYAYLAQLGVTGREADRRYTEIVEFAELEEYIGQPVKTYSTGMAVRLMFSTATAITPELLVLDEVLGVGDAYFAQKSYERMRELTEGAGTTLLLVTHDIYSAVKICDRLIWIDRGRVLMDGDGPTVVAAYEDSIRQQEETRLRTQKQQRLTQLVKSSEAVRPEHALVEIQSEGNQPVVSPVYFGRIELVTKSGRWSLPLDENGFDEQRPSHLQREGSSWGDMAVHDGRPARAWHGYDSPFHKVVGVFPWHPAEAEDARLEVDYHSAGEFVGIVRLFMAGAPVILGRLEGQQPGWRTWSAQVGSGSTGPSSEVNPSGIHGTGAIGILDITPIGHDGRESHFFKHGEPFELRLAYRINQPGLVAKPQVLIAFHRDGVQDVSRSITRDLILDSATSPEGELRLRIPSFPLGNGTYTITVMVAREGYYDEVQTRYFTLNPGVFSCHTRAVEIVVTDAGAVGSGTGVVIPGIWSLHP